MIQLECLKRRVYGVMAGYPLWLLQIRDTSFDDTEFARTEAGHYRAGVAHGVRRELWEQLRVDAHVTTTVPQAVLDKQSDDPLSGLKGKGKGRKGARISGPK